ncbi:hypothetical protein CP532_0200 [Ophiocordyceps camponoti-leonardi (nom. inval.)]|nr:hypothetical protein CP532_0200 [Ophiocordyceps camponoti-leonardi (nom. inval.)]
MYKISLAAGALAALNGAWAQESSSSRTEEIKGYEGQYVDACNPIGTVNLNGTFPPCVSASRIESSCAVAWKEGLSDEQRQADWEAERKCLCEGSFFEDAGKGCPGCKKAYAIESEENTDLWLGAWTKIQDEYCKAEGGMTGNFTTYWSAGFGEIKEQLKYPVEGKKTEAGSIPVEEYYTNDKQGPGPLPGSIPVASNSTSNSTSPSVEGEQQTQGIAQLTPDCRNLIGAIDTLPASNSAKFSNSSSGAVLVSVQTIFNRLCIINGAEREIKAQPQAEPEVKPISEEVTSKEQAAEKAEVDMTACPCAEKALPQGKQAVKSELSVQAWTMIPIYVVKPGVPAPAEKPTTPTEGQAKCATGSCGKVEGPAGGEAPVYTGGEEAKCHDGSCGRPETPSVEQPQGEQPQAEEPKCPDGSCGQTEAPPAGGEKPPVYSGGEQPEAGQPQCPTGSCGQVETPSAGDAPDYSGGEQPEAEKPECTDGSCEQAPAPAEATEEEEGEEMEYCE